MENSKISEEFSQWCATEQGSLIHQMLEVNLNLKPRKIKTHSDVVLKTGTESIQKFKESRSINLVNPKAEPEKMKKKLSEFLQEDEILDNTVPCNELDMGSFIFQNREFSHEPIQKLKQEYALKNDGLPTPVAPEESAQGEKYTFTKYYNDLVNKRKIKREIPDFYIGVDFSKLREGKRRIINVEMISDTEFGVTHTFMITQELVAIFRKYEGRFERDYKMTVMEFRHYPEFLVEIQAFAKPKNLIVYPVPEFVFDLMSNPVPFSNELVDNFVGYDYRKDLGMFPLTDDLPHSLQESLYNFQLEGIKFGIEHHGRCLIGDEMGVGKTIQALGIACLYKEDWPLLIVVPSSLRFNWRDEILKWLDHILPHEIQIISRGNQEFDPGAKIFITSYDLATLDSAFISCCEFKIIICDEAHYLKSRNSDRSKNLIPMLMKAKRTLVLSGTPMLQRPIEIYNILRVVRPDIFHDFEQFGYRYCAPRETYSGISWNGSSNIRELHYILSKKIMIRRLKVDVLTELPTKTRQKVYVSTEIGSMKKINMFVKKIQTWSSRIPKLKERDDPFAYITEEFERLTKKGDLLNDSTLHALSDMRSYLSEAYAITGQAKMKGVIEFMNGLIENKQKFLIFGHHYEVLDALEDYCIRNRLNYIRIDGRVDQQNRYKAVKKYQTDQECLIAILSLTASSQGITLTAANTVVFAELMWTPGIMVQAEDRAHRIGQVNTVNVYYLVARNTVDDMIYPRLKLKSTVISSALDGKENPFILRRDGEKPRVYDKDKKVKDHYIKRFNKLSKSIDPTGKEQSNISDFFFSNAYSKNDKKPKKIAKDENIKAEGTKADPCKTEAHRSSTKSEKFKDDSEIFIKTNYSSKEELLPDEKEEYENLSVGSCDSDQEISEIPEPTLFSESIAEDHLEQSNIVDVENESWSVYSNPMWDEYRKLRFQRNRLIWDTQTFDKFTPVWKQMRGKIGRPKDRKNITIDEQICHDMLEAEEAEKEMRLQEQRDYERRETVLREKNKGVKHKQKEAHKFMDIYAAEIEGGNVSAYLGDYLQTRSMGVKSEAHSYFKRKKIN
ncbi:unnamed protein product [Moneuplotes crassus]|uniref:Uncharacterized protein n=1 Tax=Euplotes crassus TaxID=5936 RepID=A0AAD2D384_EUPCR|nr:unnamed protein product [Moneuplotes crassus]